MSGSTLNPSLLSVSTQATGTSSIFRQRNASAISLKKMFRRRIGSTTSVNTVIPLFVTYTLSIDELRKKILEHRSLQRAGIVAVEGYVEHLVSHRFLVLELRRLRRKPIWLRLERRPGRSFISVAGSLGSVPTLDTVCGPYNHHIYGDTEHSLL